MKCSVITSTFSSSGVCVLAVYLIGGFLYQRLIVGAKGVEQFPNYNFWVEFGNLAAVRVATSPDDITHVVRHVS